MTIGIYVPTLGRPSSLQRLVDNVAAVTALSYRVWFVCEATDPESIRAGKQTGARTIVNTGGPCYSDAIQTAFDQDDARLFIAANDDFDFQPGWDTEAVNAMTGEAQVVGLNDGAPGCGFSTIALVRRGYILDRSGVVDMPARVFYPYRHNYVDTEFHATAVSRGVFVAAPDATILHKHPDWGYATRDATYLRGQATLHEDARVFESRRHLWESEHAAVRNRRTELQPH